MTSYPLSGTERRISLATVKQQEFCRRVYAAARALYEADPDNTVSPRFTTAQAMLESGWGDRAIGNNLFGMTVGSSWKGKSRLVRTTEYFTTPKKQLHAPEKVISVKVAGNGLYRYTVDRLFRDYSSLEEGLRDHNALFRKPMYADAWPRRLYAKEFARLISDRNGARYATDQNYYRTLCAMIDSVDRIIKG